MVEFFTLYSVYRTNEPKRFDVSVSRRFYKRFPLECCSLCKNRRITFFPDNSPVHVRCFRHVKRVVSQRSYYKMFIGRTSHDEPSHSSQIVSARRVNCREIFLFFETRAFENFSLYSHGAHARGMNKCKNKFVIISLRYDAPNTRIKKKEKEKILSRNNFFAWPLTTIFQNGHCRKFLVFNTRIVYIPFIRTRARFEEKFLESIFQMGYWIWRERE